MYEIATDIIRLYRRSGKEQGSTNEALQGKIHLS